MDSWYTFYKTYIWGFGLDGRYQVSLSQKAQVQVKSQDFVV